MNHNKSYESEFNKSGEIRDNSEKIEPISVWSVIEELNAEAEKKYDDFMSHNVNELNKILNHWTIANRDAVKRIMREMIEKQDLSRTWEFWPDRHLAHTIVNGLKTATGKVRTYPKGKPRVITLRRPEITPSEVIEEFVKRFENNFPGLTIVGFNKNGNRVLEMICFLELNLVI